MTNTVNLIHSNSGKTDYYTPAYIVEAARATMGGIDLDPASSPIANTVVKATNYYTEYGLTQVWFGRVWLNHPFSRAENSHWISKLIDSYLHGDIDQACCITFASTSEAWFTPLQDYPQCDLSPRTNYWLPDGSITKDVPKGSVVTYLGANVNAFIANFHNKLGKVQLPVTMYDGVAVQGWAARLGEVVNSNRRLIETMRQLSAERETDGLPTL